MTSGITIRRTTDPPGAGEQVPPPLTFPDTLPPCHLCGGEAHVTILAGDEGLHLCAGDYLAVVEGRRALPPTRQTSTQGKEVAYASSR